MSIEAETGAQDPAPPLFVELKVLHFSAGKPSARAIAKAVGDVSHTTVAEALSGRRLPSWQVLAKIVNHLGGDESHFYRLWMDVEYQRQRPAAGGTNRSARNVVVIHGRDEHARRALFGFLRALDLRPLEWEMAVRATGQAMPFLTTVLESAMTEAQAAVVLLTPDDVVHLRPSLQTVDEPGYETMPTGQPRPNVLIELGMALMAWPERTIIVEMGNMRPIADLAGRPVIRFDDSSVAIRKLAHRLKIAGCAVNDAGTDWLDTTRFAGIEDQPEQASST